MSVSWMEKEGLRRISLHYKYLKFIYSLHQNGTLGITNLTPETVKKDKYNPTLSLSYQTKEIWVISVILVPR